MVWGVSREKSVRGLKARCVGREAQLGTRLARFQEAQVLRWSVEKNKHSDVRQSESRADQALPR